MLILSITETCVCDGTSFPDGRGFLQLWAGQEESDPNYKDLIFKPLTFNLSASADLNLFVCILFSVLLILLRIARLCSEFHRQGSSYQKNKVILHFCNIWVRLWTGPAPFTQHLHLIVLMINLHQPVCDSTLPTFKSASSTHLIFLLFFCTLLLHL